VFWGATDALANAPTRRQWQQMPVFCLIIIGRIMRVVRKRRLRRTGRENPLRWGRRSRSATRTVQARARAIKNQNRQVAHGSVALHDLEVMTQLRVFRNNRRSGRIRQERTVDTRCRWRLHGLKSLSLSSIQPKSRDDRCNRLTSDKESRPA